MRPTRLRGSPGGIPPVGADATDVGTPRGSETATEEGGTPTKLTAGKLAGEAEATLVLPTRFRTS
jgi:hypothetical protein